MARPTWKGLLQISLVTIPIKVFPATDEEKGPSFHQLHGVARKAGMDDRCLARLQQKRWCPRCEREVPGGEILRGYAFEPNKYVTLSEAELATVKPASTRIIDLVQFAMADVLDLTHIDRSYYIEPDGVRAAEAFAVIRAAMEYRVGVGKVALYGREYLVAVRPHPLKPVLLLHTLHHAAEIRDIEYGDRPKVPSDQLRLARQVITAITRPRLNLTDFTDTYRDGLRRLIDAKIKGKAIVVPTVIEEPPAVTLREALTQSLFAVKKRPAKAAAVAKRKRA